jgi:hypothetical protein
MHIVIVLIIGVDAKLTGCLKPTEASTPVVDLLKAILYSQ